MTVGSILEIYTTLYGWKFYDMLWALFSQTGIALYPFMMMVYKNWRSPAENSSTVSTVGLSSLQAMKWDFLFKVVVLMIAVVPLTNIDVSQMKYAKACGGEVKEELIGGSTESTWDDMVDPVPSSAANPDVQVPLLFHFVMQLASGINAVMINNMPCVEGIAELNQQLANVILDDPELKKEYSRFFTECHVRARSKLNEALEQKSGPLYDHVKSTMSTGGYETSTLLELDSDFFRETPGFYLRCDDPGTCGYSLQALKPVDGFTPSTAPGERDAAMPPSQAALGAGHPWCGEWWDSLRPRLVNAAKLQGRLTMDNELDDSALVKVAGFVDNISAIYSNFNLSTAEQEKLVLRRLIGSNPPDFTGIYEGEESTYAEYMQAQSQALNRLGLDGAAGIATAIGGTVVFGALSSIPGVGDVGEAAVSQVAGFYVSLMVVKIAAPMMQALVLMMIYALLPIYLIVSEYKVESVITALVLVFTVKIVTLVFALAEYLENTLFAAMHPELGDYGGIATFGIEYLVLNMMLLMLYLVGPMLLLYLVTMAGENISKVGSSGDGGAGQASKMGQGLGGSAGKGVTKAASALGNKNRK
ncbi:MAG: conjugal transfer protein TraG N-terminal domain-containing protein [Gammaproteobacteria bacterium]|nr:conjugal transfer protein TraG N-terminal domain-containing protein [Gammaproteobacteria bacterium]